MNSHGEAIARETPVIALPSGNVMPALGLGTWELVQDTAGTVAHALKLGYRMIDTSGDYGTQPGIGEAIRRSGRRRDELFVVTKVEETEDAYEATRENLAELNLDRADLVLIHRPSRSGAGHELWEGLARAKRDRLTKDIGVSNYSVDLIRDLIGSGGETPAVNQIEWTPFGYSMEMMQFCREQRIVIQAYSPLTRATRLEDETLARIGRRHRKTAAQVLIRWNLQLGTAPLPKANRRAHLEENLEVFDFTLGEDDMDALSALNEHSSALGSLPYV